MQGGLRGPSPWVKALAYGGLIPFLVLAALAWLPANVLPFPAAGALLAYGATIVSFLGAIHWGLAMRDEAGPQPGRLAWGVVPSLMAWIALLLPVVHGLALLAAILWACFAVDRAVYPRFGLQAWLPMRRLLSVLASLACIVAAVGEQAC
jgi:hypothetical protein